MSQQGDNNHNRKRKRPSSPIYASVFRNIAVSLFNMVPSCLAEMFVTSESNQQPDSDEEIINESVIPTPPKRRRYIYIPANYLDDRTSNMSSTSNNLSDSNNEDNATQGNSTQMQIQIKHDKILNKVQRCVRSLPMTSYSKFNQGKGSNKSNKGYKKLSRLSRQLSDSINVEATVEIHRTQESDPLVVARTVHTESPKARNEEEANTSTSLRELPQGSADPKTLESKDNSNRKTLLDGHGMVVKNMIEGEDNNEGTEENRTTYISGLPNDLLTEELKSWKCFVCRVTNDDAPVCVSCLSKKPIIVPDCVCCKSSESGESEQSDSDSLNE